MSGTYIKPKDWENYKKVLNDFFNNDIGLQPITWLKHIDIPPEFGEDTSSYQSIPIHGLLHYNYIKLLYIYEQTVYCYFDLDGDDSIRHNSSVAAL